MNSSEHIRMIEEGDIILYKTEQGKVKLKNMFESGELDRQETVSKMEIVQYEVLQGKGTVQAKVAKALAEDVYSKYRVQQDKEYVSDFDREIKKQLGGSGYEF